MRRMISILSTLPAIPPMTPAAAAQNFSAKAPHTLPPEDNVSDGAWAMSALKFNRREALRVLFFWQQVVPPL